jgi:membrane protease YdiL (CAAX protease family)
MSGVMFGSLVVLLWPIVRGVPVRSMMADIGWESRNPFAEGFVGALSYSCLIIPMIVGILLTVVISFGISIFVEAGEFDSAGPVGHPIVEELASGDWMMWGFVLLGACVAAPVVEETMFRGVLYRYLRDEAGSGKNRFWSVCVSSAANALIFALIHPQGVVAVPALMTLAIGFSLVREWRSSLLAPILMHAANNFLVTSVLFLLIS